MTSLRPIYRQAWRHSWRRPLQSFFLIVGVAIGVAMIVAIDLANGSADRAFQLGAETVTGKATHQITGGPSGLDEALYARVRIDAAYRLSAPVVESYVVADALDGQPMRLLGVDPFAEAPFRSYLGPGDQTQGPAASYLTELMVQPNTVLLSTEVAERYGLAVGDTLTVRHGVNRIDLIIVGLLAPSDDLSRRALDGLLATDIATAQEVLGKVGRIDRIDLIVPAGVEGEAVLQRIAAVLPPSARIDPTAARAGAVGEMTAAFQLNLTALSLLALVVGMFLIYNTVTFSVVQRRPVLGSLRALGMTRGEVFGMILLEAMLLGALGTLLGLGLGVLLGRGAVQLVTQTVNDLFFVVSVREIEIPTFTLVKGAVIGLLAAAIGAAFPAWEATSVPPAGALQRSNVEERTRRALPWLSLVGVGFLAVGAGLMLPEWNLIITFAGLFAVVVGVALLTPMLTLWSMVLVERLVRRRGVIMRMAPRTVTRSLSRIAVAVAALMVAVSVIIGVGVMIGSFRQTVVLWLDDVLQADIFISAPSFNSDTGEIA
ncbi:MAG: ABC transporter permease, partial [Caldilinea sp.]